MKSLPLYQFNTVSVPVTNIFSKAVEFSIDLVEGEKLLEEKQIKKMRRLV